MHLRKSCSSEGLLRRTTKMPFGAPEHALVGDEIMFVDGFANIETRSDLTDLLTRDGHQRVIDRDVAKEPAGNPCGRINGARLVKGQLHVFMHVRACVRIYINVCVYVCMYACMCVHARLWAAITPTHNGRGGLCRCPAQW
jgi:hypothetical protein